MNLNTGHFLAGERYKVERVLGTGGFGITYLCEQTGLGRKVAVKEFFMKELCNRDSDTSHISVPSVGSQELVDRFRQKFIKEARAIAALNHKHIVRIIDIFEENGTAYYVMEFVDGGSLSDKVKEGALPETVAVRYIRQIASALDYVHSKRMMHLDIKPANILLNENDETVLIDFGLAKQYDESGTQTSTTPVGISHGYAPLEQYKRGGVGTFSPATDIYSLGATLYKLLTGETPPEAGDVMNEGLPELPVGISANVRKAVETAMQPAVKKRPQSISEFLSLLDGNVKAESGKVKTESNDDGATEILHSVQDDKYREKNSSTNLGEVPQAEGYNPNRASVISTERSGGEISSTGDGATIVTYEKSSISGENKNQQCGTTREVRPKNKGRKKSHVMIMVTAVVLLFLVVGFFVLKPGGNSEPSEQKIDFSSEQKRELMDKYNLVDEFHDGIARVASSETGLMGFIDKNGMEVVPCKYNGIYGMLNGYYCAEYNQKYGFLDSKGNVAVPFEYEYAHYNFSGGLAAVKKNGKWGFVDKNGKLVIECQYDRVSDFQNGRALAAKNGEVFFVDKNGSRLFKVMNLDGYNNGSYLRLDCAGGLYSIYHNDNRDNGNHQSVTVDKNGKIWNPGYDYVGLLDYKTMESRREPLFGAVRGDKLGLIDRSGNEVVPLGKYDGFDDDIAIGFKVSKNGKWGCLDLRGKEVVPCEYDNAWMFSKNLAQVKKDGNYGFVDTCNRVIVPLKYDDDNMHKYPGLGTIKVVDGYNVLYYDYDGNILQ